MVVLSYLSNSAILHYLPIDKRQELSKKVPAFRVANRKIPYRINRVYIHIRPKFFYFRLDYYDIQYFCKNGKIIRSTPLNRTDGIEHADDDVLPEDIEIRNKLLKKLLKYFFNRPRTRVDVMTFGNWDDNEWCEEDDFNEIQLKIGTLGLRITRSNRHCTMELFKNSQFSEIEITIYELEDIDRIKIFNGSRNAHFIINVSNFNIDLQSLIDMLIYNQMKYSLKLDYNMFKNFLETLKTWRSFPIFTVKSSYLQKELPDFQLKNIGGVESVVTKECKVKCYTFSTSDPEKEVIVTWEKYSVDGFPLDMYYFEAKVQKSGTSEPCTSNVTN